LATQRRAQAPSRAGPFTLAAVVEGSTATFRAPHRSVPNLKLVVLGTSYFANPQFPHPDGNPLFILALAQWLTQDGHNLAMPPKSSPYRPLRILPPWLKVLTKGMGYFFIPALIVLAGIFHWRHRRGVRADVRRWMEEGATRA
jgi:4-amino-4-deoxy-L-arabinose transferase-like glycosyltransferase